MTHPQMISAPVISSNVSPKDRFCDYVIPPKGYPAPDQWKTPLAPRWPPELQGKAFTWLYCLEFIGERQPT
jgi:hypothetical protein